MKKLLLTPIIVTFSLLSTVNAQTNPLANPTWEVEMMNADGSATFKKAKWIKFPEEEPKFNFFQFEADKKFHTETSCFHMMGTYSVYEVTRLK